MLENTHAHSMGQPLTPAYTREVAAIAHERGVPLHVDGARLFNAVVAARARRRASSLRRRRLGDLLPVEGPRLPGRLGRRRVGRLHLAGAPGAQDASAAACARSGILAAAGPGRAARGPDGMIERLADDHANARRLAEALADMRRHRVSRAARPTRPVVSIPPEWRRTSSSSGSNGTATLPRRLRQGVLMVPYAHGAPGGDPSRQSTRHIEDGSSEPPARLLTETEADDGVASPTDRRHGLDPRGRLRPVRPRTPHSQEPLH